MYTSVIATVGLGDIAPRDGEGRVTAVICGWVLTGLWSTFCTVFDELTGVVLYLQAVSIQAEGIIRSHRGVAALILVLLLAVHHLMSSLIYRLCR
jgi:hypothetical protein